MIQININNKKVVNSLNDTPSLKNMIDYIIEEKMKKDELITQVKIDDRKIDLDNENELSRVLQKDNIINFQIKSSLDLAFDSLKDCSDYINSSIFQIKEVIELYQKNEIQQGNKQFPDIIDSIDFFVRLITKIHRAILSSQSSKNTELKSHIQNLEIHLLAALKNLLPAKEKTDLTLLCDLLEYELCDNLDQWNKEILPALDRLRKKT